MQHADVVGDRDHRPGLAGAPAQVHVLGVQPITFIQTVQAIEQRAGQQHQRAGYGVHRLQHLRVVRRHAEFRRATGCAQHLGEDRVATPCGRVAHARFVDQVDAQQDLAGGTRRMRAQPRQRVGFHHQVRIDEGQPRRMRIARALVAPDCETRIVGIGDETYAAVVQCMPLHDGQGGIGGGIVDHADLLDAVRQAQAHQAIVDGVRALVGHHHHGDGIRLNRRGHAGAPAIRCRHTGRRDARAVRAAGRPSGRSPTAA